MADYKIPIITGTSLAVGDILRWNGTDWVNYPDDNYGSAGGLDLLDGGSSNVLLDTLVFDAKSPEIFTDAGFGSWADEDSIDGTLIKNEVYKVDSDGFVVLNQTDGGPGESTIIKTDESNPPTTTRVLRLSPYYIGMMCPVKKDDYWKVQVAGSGNPTIYWLPIGSGTCVKQ